MLTNELLRTTFAAAAPYAAYVASGKPHEVENWNTFRHRVHLTNTQQDLIGGFVRRVHVLVVSGLWCGDCVQQCPMFDVIEQATPQAIDVRFIDRDVHSAFTSPLTICGGHRVPVVLFMNEDFDFVSLAGDRTLTRYRALAERQLGSACPMPGAPVPSDEVAGTLQDWVNEFERVELMLRLSNKLRQRHGD